MSTTPNLNLALPAHASSNWDTPLNSNFSLIDAGVMLNAPTGDQTISGGHKLINNGGAFEVINTSATPSDASLDMNIDASGHAFLQYREGAVSSDFHFNPTTGAVVLDPPSAGAGDGGHGVVINNSGLYLAGHFADGNAITAANGNAAFAGAGPTGTPILILGSTGVEGVIETVPQTGVGTYVLRSPNTAVNSVLNLPIGTGTLGLIVAAPSTAASAGVAGTFAFDASFIYCCVALNTWKRVAISTW